MCVGCVCVCVCVCAEVLVQMTKYMHQEEIPAGEVIFVEVDHTTPIYFIVFGEVLTATKQHERQTDGQDPPLFGVCGCQVQVTYVDQRVDQLGSHDLIGLDHLQTGKTVQ